MRENFFKGPGPYTLTLSDGEIFHLDVDAEREFEFDGDFPMGIYAKIVFSVVPDQIKDTTQNATCTSAFSALKSHLASLCKHHRGTL